MNDLFYGKDAADAALSGFHVESVNMSTMQDSRATGVQDAREFRKQWVKPAVSRIVAGSAEAVQRDGDPDGGNPGTSRS